MMGKTRTSFAALAELGERLEATAKRSELTTLVAGFLHALSPEEIPPGVRLLIGQAFPEWDGRALNVSWRSVSRVLDALSGPTDAQRVQIRGEAEDAGQQVKLLLDLARLEPQVGPPLELLDVYHTLEQIADSAGRGSTARKEDLLQDLLLRASSVEAKYIVKVVIGEMRHGVSEGIMLASIAEAAGAKLSLVRRADMLWGDLGEVAQVALTVGKEGLGTASLKLFRPLKPMLAQTAVDTAEAFERYGGRVALEYKLDGARVQLHKQGDRVRIYSRQLSDVTPSLPEVVDQARSGFSAEELVAEGEVVAVDDTGRPLPFQHLMRRFRRVHDVDSLVQEVPVRLYLFDLLYVDGETLIDVPNRRRWRRLTDVADTGCLVPRVEPPTIAEAEAFSQAAYRAGHEGIMAKDLSSAYSPGVRGRSWLKLKHVMTLDCVVIAAEWGYGRRHGWLSNYHLAVRDAETGDFRMVGKTFKGLTDQHFEEMTDRLLALEVERDGGTVYVEPEVVVEVLFNEVQESARYPSGFALRFARIHRVRPDKGGQDIDTLGTLQTLFEEQSRYKGQVAPTV